MKRALVAKEFHVKKSLNCIVNSVEIKFPIPIFLCVFWEYTGLQFCLNLKFYFPRLIMYNSFLIYLWLDQSTVFKGVCN